MEPNSSNIADESVYKCIAWYNAILILMLKVIMGQMRIHTIIAANLGELNETI